MPTYCVPAFTGVPGTSATNLNWWTPPQPPTGPPAPGSTVPLEKFPEDPNWLNAFLVAKGDGAGVQVQFRALNGVDGGTRFVYLSWIARVAPQPTLNVDGVNIYLGTATESFAIRIRLATTSAVNAGPVATAYSAQTYSYTGTGPIPAGATHTSAPNWVTDTGRMWVDYISPASGLSIPWAFQIAVPLDQNLAPAGGTAVTLPSDFRFWYQAQANTPSGTVVYVWPGTKQATDNLNIIPAGLVPSDMRVPASSSDPVCFVGVTLPYSGVGVRNIDGSSRANLHRIQLDLGTPPYDTSVIPDVTLPEHQNMFFASPVVTGLTDAQKDSIRGRFRLANWGSQYHIPTEDSWKTIPGAESVVYQREVTNPDGSVTAANELRHTWPRPPLDAFTTNLINGIKTFLNLGGTSGRNDHMCILIELSSTDPGIVFTRSSIFVNMNFVNASVFERLAEISVIGLAPISPQPRDVYLYVEKTNMPQVIGIQDRDRLERLRRGMFSDTGMTVAARRKQPLEVEDILAFVPSFSVHAYHDTGLKMTFEDGSETPILEPQTSFGYFVQHEGDLVGWETRLDNAEKITENFYVVRVPNESSVQVRTRIQAREHENDAPIPPENFQDLPGCPTALLVALLKQLGPVGQAILRFFNLGS